MDERASDIVAILTETGTRTRRERAAYVAKLKDELGMTFSQIGAQLHISPQRAQQLYTLNKYFQRSASSPFANLSARARHFLDKVASHSRLGDDWEQDPAKIAALVNLLTNMTKTEAFKFRHLGAQTFQEIADFMQQQGVKFPLEFNLGEALADDPEFYREILRRLANAPDGQISPRVRRAVIAVDADDPLAVERLFKWIYGLTTRDRSSFVGQMLHPDWYDSESDAFAEALEDVGEVESKDLTRATTTEQSMELITQFLNEKGLTGEFKVWPHGTYKGPYADNAEFVITLSGFLADAFEEGWSVIQEFEALVKSLGLHSEMATASVIVFYHDPYFDPDSIRIPQTPEQVEKPPPNLQDISFD